MPNCPFHTCTRSIEASKQFLANHTSGHSTEVRKLARGRVRDTSVPFQYQPHGHDSNAQGFWMAEVEAIITLLGWRFWCCFRDAGDACTTRVRLITLNAIVIVNYLTLLDWYCQIPAISIQRRSLLKEISLVEREDLDLWRHARMRCRCCEAPWNYLLTGAHRPFMGRTSLARFIPVCGPPRSAVLCAQQCSPLLRLISTFPSICAMKLLTM